MEMQLSEMLQLIDFCLSNKHESLSFPIGSFSCFLLLALFSFVLFLWTLGVGKCLFRKSVVIFLHTVLGNAHTQEVS